MAAIAPVRPSPIAGAWYEGDPKSLARLVDEYLDRAERWLESARAVESAVAAGLKRAARLRQSVLRSAFEGRLV